MHRTLSIIDLLSFKESRQIVMEGNEEDLNNLLHTVGFDLEEEIELQYCLHRPMVTHIPVEGYRIFGRERTDPEWVSSEYCTMENKLEIIGTKDVSLLRELLEMRKEGNFTQMIVEHMNGAGVADG